MKRTIGPLGPSKYWEGYNKPDPEGEQALIAMLRRAAHKRACHVAGHRVENEAGDKEICPCSERCQECGDERMEAWRHKFWKLEKLTNWALKQRDPQQALDLIKLGQLLGMI